MDVLNFLCFYPIKPLRLKYLNGFFIQRIYAFTDNRITNLK